MNNCKQDYLDLDNYQSESVPLSRSLYSTDSSLASDNAQSIKAGNPCNSEDQNAILNTTQDNYDDDVYCAYQHVGHYTSSSAEITEVQEGDSQSAFVDTGMVDFFAKEYIYTNGVHEGKFIKRPIPGRQLQLQPTDQTNKAAAKFLDKAKSIQQSQERKEYLEKHQPIASALQSVWSLFINPSIYRRISDYLKEKEIRTEVDEYVINQAFLLAEKIQNYSQSLDLKTTDLESYSKVNNDLINLIVDYPFNDFLFIRENDFLNDFCRTPLLRILAVIIGDNTKDLVPEFLLDLIASVTTESSLQNERTWRHQIPTKEEELIRSSQLPKSERAVAKWMEGNKAKADELGGFVFPGLNTPDSIKKTINPDVLNQGFLQHQIPSDPESFAQVRAANIYVHLLHIASRIKQSYRIKNSTYATEVLRYNILSQAQQIATSNWCLNPPDDLRHQCLDFQAPPLTDPENIADFVDRIISNLETQFSELKQNIYDSEENDSYYLHISVGDNKIKPIYPQSERAKLEQVLRNFGQEYTSAELAKNNDLSSTLKEELTEYITTYLNHDPQAQVTTEISLSTTNEESVYLADIIIAEPKSPESIALKVMLKPEKLDDLAKITDFCRMSFVIHPHLATNMEQVTKRFFHKITTIMIQSYGTDVPENSLRWAVDKGSKTKSSSTGSDHSRRFAFKSVLRGTDVQGGLFSTPFECQIRIGAQPDGFISPWQGYILDHKAFKQKQQKEVAEKYGVDIEFTKFIEEILSLLASQELDDEDWLTHGLGSEQFWCYRIVTEAFGRLNQDGNPLNQATIDQILTDPIATLKLVNLYLDIDVSTSLSMQLKNRLPFDDNLSPYHNGQETLNFKQLRLNIAALLKANFGKILDSINKYLDDNPNPAFNDSNWNDCKQLLDRILYFDDQSLKDQYMHTLDRLNREGRFDAIVI